ncbi:hypothetical protein NEOC65_002304 [Neochlamydia sp. AcF65]|nr:hypothetical protein [Neochlamydia sp. AcF65]
MPNFTMNYRIQKGFYNSFGSLNFLQNDNFGDTAF